MQIASTRVAASPPPTDALAAQAQAKDAQATEAAAKGFESLFMSMLLKQMRETLEPGTMFGEQGAEIYGGLFDTYLGQHLAQGEVLGIAKAVKARLNAPEVK